MGLQKHSDVRPTQLALLAPWGCRDWTPLSRHQEPTPGLSASLRSRWWIDTGADGAIERLRWRIHQVLQEPHGLRRSLRKWLPGYAAEIRHPCGSLHQQHGPLGRKVYLLGGPGFYCWDAIGNREIVAMDEKIISPPSTTIVEDESHGGLHYAPRGEVITDASSIETDIVGYDDSRMKARSLLTEAEEKKLMRRIDWHLMPLCSIMFLLKNIDANNVCMGPNLRTLRSNVSA